MSQRFFQYRPTEDDTGQCEAAHCTNTAYWWDAQQDALFCDFHAMAKADPVRVPCEVCASVYPASWVHNGVCMSCRSVMTLLWTD